MVAPVTASGALGSAPRSIRPSGRAPCRHVASGVRYRFVSDAPRFGRRTLLGGALVAGASVAGAAGAGERGYAYAATTASGTAPSGAPGLGPNGALLLPDSLPHPRLPAGTDTIPEIDHVVVLMMENHSFDDHFGMLGRGDGLTRAAGRQAGQLQPGARRRLHRHPSRCPTPSARSTRTSPRAGTRRTSAGTDGTNLGFAQNCGPASMGYFTEDATALLLLAGQPVPHRRPLLLLGDGADLPEPAVPHRRHRAGRRLHQRLGHLVHRRPQRDHLRPARRLRHHLEGLLPRHSRPRRSSCPTTSTT